MSRTLITKQNYRKFLDPDGKSISICNQMMVTPGAKDFLREQQIKIIYDNQKRENPKKYQDENVEKKPETAQEECPLVERIYFLMKEEFNTDNRNLAQKIADLIMTK